MIKLDVNGREHQVEADEATPLLYVLRDDLELNGAKYGCGLGQCGACTVLVDDKPVFSCIVPIAALQGRRVTTLEGLGTTDDPGPLPRAFIEEQAAQCGFCIPGMIMRAQALLLGNNSPSEAQIRDHMRANLCRCGTHMRILAAVRRAAGTVRSASADRQTAGDAAMKARPRQLSRRDVVAGSGALIVSFSLLASAKAQEAQNVGARPEQKPRLPGSLRNSPLLDSWIRIDAQGITVLTGKVELGQGIKTALIQVAAEELAVEPDAITLVTADTTRTPNEGYTAGSLSMQDSATAIRHAAAQAREISDRHGGNAARRERGEPEGGERRGRRERRPPRSLWRPGRGRSAARRSATSIQVEGAGHVRSDRQTDGARRHSCQGDGRHRLCAGPPIAINGARARRASAELWRAAAVSRCPRSREVARRAENRARRQLSRGRCRARISGGAGHECARPDRQLDR